jgi:hypothetical protein
MASNQTNDERLAAAWVRLSLFCCEDGSLHAHWTAEDREILEGRASHMAWMDELAQHEARS